MADRLSEVHPPRGGVNGKALESPLYFFANWSPPTRGRELKFHRQRIFESVWP